MECKVGWLFYRLVYIYRYSRSIVECKGEQIANTQETAEGYSRSIVECKDALFNRWFFRSYDIVEA